MIVQLTERFRLRPYDRRNWQLQEFRPVEGRDGILREPDWVDCGAFFSDPGNAAAYVLRLDARELRHGETVSLREFQHWYERAEAGVRERVAAGFKEGRHDGS